MKNGGMFGIPSPAKRRRRVGPNYKKASTTHPTELKFGFFVSRDFMAYGTGSSNVNTAISDISEFSTTCAWPPPCANTNGNRTWNGTSWTGEGTYFPLWENGDPPTYAASGVGFDFGRPVTPWTLQFRLYNGFSGSPSQVTIMYSHNGYRWYDMGKQAYIHTVYNEPYAYEVRLPRFGVKARYWGVHNTLASTNALSYTSLSEGIARCLDASNTAFIDEFKNNVLLTNRHMYMAHQYWNIGELKRGWSREVPAGALTVTITGNTQARIFVPSRGAHDWNRSVDGWAAYQASIAGVTDYGFFTKEAYYLSHPAGNFRLWLQSKNDDYRILNLGPYLNRVVTHGLGEIPNIYLYVDYLTQWYIVHPELLYSGTTPGAINASNYSPDPDATSDYLASTWEVSVNTVTDQTITTKRQAYGNYGGMLVVFRDDSSCITYGTYTGTGSSRYVEINDLDEIGSLWLQYLPVDGNGNPTGFDSVWIDKSQDLDNYYFTAAGGEVRIIKNRIHFTGTYMNASGGPYYYVATKRWQ